MALWKVLLIDDDEADRLAFRRMIKEEGIAADLVFARSGAEALSILAISSDAGSRDRPDLIVLDLNMSGIGGFDVLKMLKADLSTRTIPVVVLTTSSNPYDVEASYALGASSYIIKPASVDGFRKVIRGLSAYWADLVSRPA